MCSDSIHVRHGHISFMYDEVLFRSWHPMYSPTHIPSHPQHACCRPWGRCEVVHGMYSSTRECSDGPGAVGTLCIHYDMAHMPRAGMLPPHADLSTSHGTIRATGPYRGTYRASHPVMHVLHTHAPYMSVMGGNVFMYDEHPASHLQGTPHTVHMCTHSHREGAHPPCCCDTGVQVAYRCTRGCCGWAGLVQTMYIHHIRVDYTLWCLHTASTHISEPVASPVAASRCAWQCHTRA